MSSINDYKNSLNSNNDDIESDEKQEHELIALSGKDTNPDKTYVDVEQLAEVLSNRLQNPVSKMVSNMLREPVDEWMQMIEGIPNTIPGRVKEAMINVLDEIQSDVQVLIEHKVKTLLKGYMKALEAQQIALGVRLLKFMGILSVLGIALTAGLAFYITPSYSQIEEARALLSSLQRNIKTLPQESIYNGHIYVMVVPGTEITAKGPDGLIHTYSMLTDPTKKSLLP